LARSSLEIFPEDDDSRMHELEALAALGRTDEVRATIETWFASWSQGWARPGRLSWALEELKRHGYREEALLLAERAVRWCKDAVAEGEPRQYALAVALYQAEHWDEAEALYEDLGKDHPDYLPFKRALGTLAARKGNRDEAIRILEELLEGDDPYLYGQAKCACAAIAAQLGDRQRAVDLLNDAVSEGYRGIMSTTHRDVDLEPLRDYPPFQEFVRPKG
jgi:tetratricopeptide (TPR) repeat protein